jgi:hypothetical protein
MTKQSFKVVVPTYGRHEAIGKYTMKYLRSTDVDLSQVYLFVANSEEAEKYKSSNEDVNIVVGVKGLTQQRKFISEYFDPGTRLLSLDDDVSGLQRLVLLEKLDSLQKPLDFPCKLELVTDLVQFVENGWELAADREVELWGAYQVANKGFLHPKVKTGALFIMGHFFSFLAGDNVFDEIVEYPCKDDVFWSIWHHVNRKGTLRFDNYCVKSKAHSGSGGTNEDMLAKLQINNDTCEAICAKYPEIASIKMRKTKDEWLSQYKEIRLKPITYETIDVRESCY